MDSTCEARSPETPSPTWPKNRVGACTVTRRGHHVEDQHIGVLGIEVHPDWRGRGVGTALLEEALRGSATRFEIVELRVLGINERAIRLYQKYGFREFGRQPRSFKRGDRYLEDVLMWRPVDASQSADSADSVRVRGSASV